MPTYNVFVYGSLKRGFHNHPLIEQQHVKPIFKGLDKIKGTMLNLGQFPALVPGNTLVSGEVWEVSGTCMVDLDRLEGHPHIYQRYFHTLESGEKAWVYFLSKSYHYTVRNSPVVKSGIWTHEDVA